MEKLFRIVFTILGINCTICIAFGAYWHVYTAAACWLLVWAGMKFPDNPKDNK